MESKIKILDMIAEDMKNDAKKFDGRPFNGKTVAEYFGNQGAAIAALAKLMKSMVEKSISSIDDCDQELKLLVKKYGLASIQKDIERLYVKRQNNISRTQKRT